MSVASGQDVIAIDGPAGSGKTTVSRQVARALGYTVLDTGAMYRAAALKLHAEEVGLEDLDGVARVMASTDIRIEDGPGGARILLDGEDVSQAIRGPGMGQAASDASALAPVRSRLVELQRAAGRRGRVVAEGRDMGTVVFPQARFKFYLNADLQERARRRWEEERSRGIAVDRGRTEEEIALRDRQDSGRDLAPLRRADDALEIDTTGRTIDEVVEMILDAVRAGIR